MEYTKGEWEKKGLGIFKKNSAENELGLICLCQVDSSVEEAIANANLIAVSPRMAQLLERLVKDGWNASISEEARVILQTLA